MSRRILTLANRVCPIGIRKHGELFVVSDQFVDQHFRCLIVAVVVRCAVDQ